MECRVLQWMDISCMSDQGNKACIKKFGRLIVDMWPCGRVRSRWKNNPWVDWKETDRRWIRLAMIMSISGFWYCVEHSVFLHLFYLHIFFSKVKIKCNSELEVKKRVVWPVFKCWFHSLGSIWEVGILSLWWWEHVWATAWHPHLKFLPLMALGSLFKKC